MRAGKDYIVFPLDVASSREAESLVRCLDNKVGMFKVGLELFVLEGPGIIRMIKGISNAGVFLDLKFHDISATVGKAMERVADLGVDLVTVHCSSSAKMLEAAVKGSRGRARVLGVTLLTDNDARVVADAGFKREFVDDPGRLVLKRARMAFEAGCAGVVCSGNEARLVRETFGTEFLVVTPGIRPAWSMVDHDDQKRVTTPAMAVREGADYIVVGRPIRSAADPGMAAEQIAVEIETCQYQDV